MKEKGTTVIPLKFYFKGSNIKVEIGICKGKKLYDKRDSIIRRETEREIGRAVKRRSFEGDNS